MMIGLLPKTLEVDGKDYKIRYNFTIALLIFQAFNDSELSFEEKVQVCIECLYEDTTFENSQQAFEKAMWFLDGGNMPKAKPLPYKIMDWEQDEQLFFPAINKVAGYETREAEKLHWWTFLGFFNEINEGLYSQVMNIRTKKAKGKTLDKVEKEFYHTHKNLIDLKEPLTPEDKEEMAYINSLI